MVKKFPYGHDVNAYIDKAFEQLKADFPWATRDMIAEHTLYGIAKVGSRFQYVAFWSNSEGKPEPYPQKTDCEGFIKKLYEGHEWELERANPVKASAISVILRWIPLISTSKATICSAMVRLSNTPPLPSRKTAPRRN